MHPRQSSKMVFDDVEEFDAYYGEQKTLTPGSSIPRFSPPPSIFGFSPASSISGSSPAPSLTAFPVDLEFAESGEEETRPTKQSPTTSGVTPESATAVFSPIPTQPPESTALVLPVPEPTSITEGAPAARSHIVSFSIPEPHATALTGRPPEPIQEDPAVLVPNPPESFSRAETEHAADRSQSTPPSDGIEWPGQDERQLPTRIPSQPEEAFAAPMIFYPHKYTFPKTSKKTMSASPNPVSSDRALPPPTLTNIAALTVDGPSSTGMTTPPQNPVEPRQDCGVAFPPSSGAVEGPIANPFECEQSSRAASPAERHIVPIHQATSIGASSSNCDAASIDVPLPSPNEFGFPISSWPIQIASVDGRKSNRYSSGEFFGYDTGMDELRPLLQTSTTSLEYTHTPNYGHTRPARSGASVTSQYQGHMGAVTRLRSASVEWQEFLLPDGSRYFSHRTLRIVTDVDLRGVERLDAITRFLDESNMETIPPPGWELWLRDGHESTIAFIPSQAWIHHGKRMVVFEPPAPDLGELMSSDIDKMESEYQYWLFMVSHPVHAPLPPESVAEAIEVLTWFYINRLLPSQRLSPPPFSEEECQELLMQLRSFNHMSVQTVSLVRTCVVSTVLVRVVAWKQGRHWDGAIFQDSRRKKNALSTGRSLLRAAGDFVISFICCGTITSSKFLHKDLCTR